jgi:hypothetical protein
MQKQVVRARVGILLGLCVLSIGEFAAAWALLSDADRRVFGTTNQGYSRREVIELYLQYTDTYPACIPASWATMTTFSSWELAKPMINLFAGCKGGKRFRAAVAEAITVQKWGVRQAVTDALQHLDPVEAALEDRPPTSDGTPD